MVDDEPVLTGDPHPETWDLICVGTGLAETMLAGAAAKAGKSVLHVDPGESYGAGWGALAENPDGVGWRVPGVATDAIPEPAIAPSSAPDALAPPRDGERDILLPAAHTAPAPTRAPSASILAPDPDALGARRGYVLDLAAPKLVFCADAFVDALVASGAHKYVEFKPLEATYVFWDGAFHRVPASRAEVFRDRAMSPGDKRALMRFLKRVLRAAEDAGAAVGSRDPDDANRAVGAPGSEWRDDSGSDPSSTGVCPDPSEAFASSLRERHGLSPRLAAAVQYALALRDDANATSAEGYAALAKYVSSIGRFGPETGATLCPMYGASEFPQAFARVAAVAGAAYVLRLGVRAITVADVDDDVPRDDEITATGIVTSGGQRLRCRALAVSSDVANPAASNPARVVSRAVWVMDGPVTPPETNQALFVFPPDPNRPGRGAARVAQTGAATNVAPAGKYILHASVAVDEGADETTAEEDLRWALEHLAHTTPKAGTGTEEDGSVVEDVSVVEDGSVVADASSRAKPRLLWGAFWRTNDARGTNDVRGTSGGVVPRNVVFFPAPDASCDFDAVVADAARARAKLFGGDPTEAFSAATGGSGGEGGTDGDDGDGRMGARADEEEDELDALLRNLPGGIGA